MSSRREYGDPRLPNQGEMERYLREDLFNDLRWLFDAAVVWEAARQTSTNRSTLERHADVHTMHATVTLARSLYEFYFEDDERYPDDARARHFCSTWDESKTSEYTSYFAPGQSANKRVSHPVYWRPKHSGGSGLQGPDHLNQRVLAVAREIREITVRFVACAATEFTTSAKAAFDGALAEAESASSALGMTNPIA